MKDYYALLGDIMNNGYESDNRTGTPTLSQFGKQIKFSLINQFPLLTGKEINYRAVINEFLWMVVEGSTDVKWLEARGHKFWSAWKQEYGTIGKGYGYQFRSAHGTDQVRNVLDSIKTNPNSRRHIIHLWNESDISYMALPPCHGNIIQFNVRGKYLDCSMYQRSADCFIGLPWNIAFYALMTEVFAHLTGYKAGALTISIGDCHIYDNHIKQTRELLSRDVSKYPLPQLNITRTVTDIDDFKLSDFEIVDYKSYPAIKAEVAV